MIDFQSMQQFLARLEWIEIALKGTKTEAGLISQLEALTAPEGAGGRPGLVPQLEQVLAESQHVATVVTALLTRLADPVDENVQQRIEMAIGRAFNEGAASFQERSETLMRLADKAAEQMARSVAEAELVSRTACDTARSARTELDLVARTVAVQLEDMLREVTEHLSSAALSKPLSVAISQAVNEVAANKSTQALLELHRTELERVGEAIKQDFRQYQEGFQEDLVEIQKEAADRVHKIVEGRPPSQALIELFDKVEVLSVENKRLRKQLDECDLKKRSSNFAPDPSKVWHLAPGIATALIGASLGALLGAGLAILML